MKFTLNWLKDYLDINADVDVKHLTSALTDIGLEVESAEDIGEALAPFIVAKIEEAARHPDADRLKVCKVNDGNAVRQIVCGAPNARAGIYVVLATEGVCIPTNGMKIKPSKIRGVESNGMLCSADELGVGADSNGIIELTGEPALGGSAADALGMNDVVFDIAITPNRGDCFGVYGVARDLAAAGIGTLKAAAIPALGDVAVNHSGASTVDVTINTDACQQFIGCSISGVKNGSSPDWLKDRLTLIGQKPISALVDITNYLTIAFGRPAHVYDVAKLRGGALDVRAAKDGETILALDHKEYALSSDMCVIADAEGPASIGGVIGGEESGCDENTTDVFLEIALFDPISVAKTGQALTLSTDARMRFERGVDVEFLPKGAELATWMIASICGGEPSEFIVVGDAKNANQPVAFKPAQVLQYTSLNVAAKRSEQILSELGFAVDAAGGGDEWKVTAPSWRHDVEGAQDLVEEIARIVGYDQIEAVSLPESKMQDGRKNITEERLSIARKVLASDGLTELHNWTFVSEAEAASVDGTNGALKLANPISSELSIMRSSLLPHLLSSAARNINNGEQTIQIFEAGQVFSGTEYSDQHMMIAGLLAGKKSVLTHGAEQFSAAAHAFSMSDAKENAFTTLAAFGVNTEQLSLTREAPDYYHPGRSMRVSLGGKVTLGYIGELHPTILKQYDVDGSAAYFEILVQNIPAPKQKSTAKKMLQLSPYPAVERDFAFVVDADVEVEKFRRAALKADKKLIKAASIFDVYQGEHMEAGKKSVALRVVLESFEKTLTDEEISAVSNAVIEQVSSATGAVLRG